MVRTARTAGYSLGHATEVAVLICGADHAPGAALAMLAPACDQYGPMKHFCIADSSTACTGPCTFAGTMKWLLPLHVAWLLT